RAGSPSGMLGRAHPDDAGARAETAGRWLRPGLDVHRSGSGHRIDRGGRMSDARIIVEKDAAIGWIRINRPERLNAFAGTMRIELLEALKQHEADADVRC